MYRWLRNTHLFLGLFTFLFVTMYAVSSVQMAHNSWLRLASAVTTRRVTIATEKGTEARALARELMDRKSERRRDKRSQADRGRLQLSRGQAGNGPGDHILARGGRRQYSYQQS